MLAVHFIFVRSAAMTNNVGNSSSNTTQSIAVTGQMALPLALLAVAVLLNIIGLNVGKWLQNAGGVATYLPLTILVALGAVLWLKQGSVTSYSWSNILPAWNWDTVNFWSQIAFAFTGLELVSAMSGEIREPRKTLPRALIAAAALIAAMGDCDVLVPCVTDRIDAGMVFVFAAEKREWVRVSVDPGPSRRRPRRLRRSWRAPPSRRP